MMKSIRLTFVAAIAAVFMLSAAAQRLSGADATNSVPPEGQRDADSAPSQFISEVLPIHYAKASDISEALRILGTHGIGIPVTEPINRLIQRASIPGTRRFADRIKVIPDERSNSILVFATRPDMELIKDIVPKLDTALTQILIEAVIFEAPLPESKGSGKKNIARQMPGPDRLLAGGALTNARVQWVTDLVSGTGTHNTVGTANGFRYVAALDQGFESLIPALAGNTNVHVIQRPRLVATDGTPATIFLGIAADGANYPEPPDQGGGPSCRYYPELECGIGLELTPAMAPNGNIEITVRQTLDEVSGTTTIAGVGEVPNTITTRSQATIHLRERETVAIGGLVTAHAGKSSVHRPPREAALLLRAFVLATPEVTNGPDPGERSRRLEGTRPE